mgnify:CR=1 FL=1
MNTAHNPPSSPSSQAPRLAPFHSSARTALSLNTDPVTGQRVQLLTTSRLEMNWAAGELQVRCKASRGVMDPDRAMQRPMRRARGAL